MWCVFTSHDSRGQHDQKSIVQLRLLHRMVLGLHETFSEPKSIATFFFVCVVRFWVCVKEKREKKNRTKVKKQFFLYAGKCNFLLRLSFEEIFDVFTCKSILDLTEIFLRVVRFICVDFLFFPVECWLHIFHVDFWL